MVTDRDNYYGLKRGGVSVDFSLSRDHSDHVNKTTNSTPRSLGLILFSLSRISKGALLFTDSFWVCIYYIFGCVCVFCFGLIILKI